MNAFLIGLQFLTRISIVKQTVWTEEDFGGSVKYFPAVGAVLGIIYALAILIVTFIISGNLTVKFPMLLSAVILTLTVAMTGAIHCDGFMDSMDGLFSGRSRERMLEIMKDSRVGAFGVTSFVMLAILNFALLTELASGEILTLISAVYSMPIIGRLMMVIVIGAFPYARPEGMGKAFAQYTTKFVILTAALETLILLLPVLILSFDMLNSIITALALTLMFTLYFGRFSVKKLGGVTGDIYGAVEIISESIVLLAFLISI